MQNLHIYVKVSFAQLAIKVLNCVYAKRRFETSIANYFSNTNIHVHARTCSKELLIFNKSNQTLLTIKPKRKTAFKGDRRWVNSLNTLAQYTLAKDTNLNQLCCVIHIIMAIYASMVVFLQINFIKATGIQCRFSSLQHILNMSIGTGVFSGLEKNQRSLKILF